MQVKARQKLERLIASVLIRDALKAGYTISVNNGEEIVITMSVDRTAILKEMFSVDEERLIFFKDGKQIGWVFFVYGNDGYDVICDYAGNLEHIMENVDKIIAQWG